MALPVLAAALVVGLLVSAAQAATRQSDSSVSAVPKLLAAGGALLVFGGWMIAVLHGFWIGLWTHLPEMVR